MTRPPSSPTATRFLLGVLAILWVAFGLIVAFNAHPSYRDASVSRPIMATLAFSLAGLLAILVRQLRQGGRLSYRFTVILLASLFLVGLFDELGLADLLYLLATFVPLVLLVKDRNWYLGPPSPTRSQQTE